MKIVKKKMIFEYSLDAVFTNKWGDLEIGTITYTNDGLRPIKLVILKSETALYIDPYMIDKMAKGFIYQWKKEISPFIVSKLLKRGPIFEDSNGTFPWCKTAEECLMILKMLYDLQNDIYNIIQNQCCDEDEKILLLKTIISQYKNENS